MRRLPAELEAKIAEIKSWVDASQGGQDEVARRSKKSREWVNKVLNGKAYNVRIVEAGIEVMNETRARFEIQTTMKIAS